MKTDTILAKRRVASTRPRLKSPSKPSPTTSPLSLSDEKKRLTSDSFGSAEGDDENYSIYSFPSEHGDLGQQISSSPTVSPVTSPESMKRNQQEKRNLTEQILLPNVQLSHRTSLSPLGGLSPRPTPPSSSRICPRHGPRPPLSPTSLQFPSSPPVAALEVNVAKTLPPSAGPAGQKRPGIAAPRPRASQNMTPLTIIKPIRNYLTPKTSLILELKSTRPNIQDLFAILMTIPNSINERDDDGMTSLMLICSSQVTNLTVAERFSLCRVIKFKFPKQFELIDNHGLTVLHHAVQFYPSPSLRLIQLILSSYPLATQIFDKTQSLPLHHAVVCGSSNSILKLLVLAHPTSVSQPDGTGLTALDYLKSKVKIPSKQTRALLSVDGVWIDPNLFTTVDTMEADPEEIYAVIFIQCWYRQFLRKRNSSSITNSNSNKSNNSSLQTQQMETQLKLPKKTPPQYKQSIRPKPKTSMRNFVTSTWHHDAATIIQAIYRGSFLRLRIKRGTAATVNIQRVIRGYLCRRKLWRLHPRSYTSLSRQRAQRILMRSNTSLKKKDQDHTSTAASKSVKSSRSVPSRKKENWETLERHSQEFLSSSSPPPSPPTSASASSPSRSSHSIKSLSSPPIWKRIKSASLIHASWSRYKSRNLLSSLTSEASFTNIILPFYYESLLIVAFYFVILKLIFGTDKVFTENELVSDYLLNPINSMALEWIGSAPFSFSFQLAHHSLLLTLLTLCTTLFIAKYLYHIPMKKTDPITSATVFFRRAYRPLYQLFNSLSLLSLTISWLLTSLVFYSHFQSLLQILLFHLTFGSTIGGILLSLLIIPLILYLPVLVYISLTLRSKSSFKFGKSKQQN